MSSPPPWYGGLALGIGALVTFLVLAAKAVLGMLAEIRKEHVEQGRGVPPANQAMPNGPAGAVEQRGAA
jgi:hypothetical protein